MAWTTNDRVNLRQYLGSNPKFLIELEARKPPITGTTTEQRAISGSDRNGYDKMREVIEEMITDPPQPASPQPFLPSER